MPSRLYTARDLQHGLKKVMNLGLPKGQGRGQKTAYQRRRLEIPTAHPVLFSINTTQPRLLVRFRRTFQFPSFIDRPISHLVSLPGLRGSPARRMQIVPLQDPRRFVLGRTTLSLRGAIFPSDNHLCNTSPAECFAANEVLAFDPSERVANGRKQEENTGGNQARGTAQVAQELDDRHGTIGCRSHVVCGNFADKVVELARCRTDA